MTKKQLAKEVCVILDNEYPTEDKCYLNYEKPYELMFATILAAQCTDDRVNIVTNDLFVKYPTLKAFAEAVPEEMERDVHSTGFYRNKAKNIILSAQKLITEYDSEMPSDINELITFPGVGRKTANVVRSHIFNIPSVVVDTHVKRVSNKLGLTHNTDPVKVEYDLMEVLPKEHWIRYNTQIIAHGRSVCKSGRPDCPRCVFNQLCVDKTIPIC